MLVLRVKVLIAVKCFCVFVQPTVQSSVLSSLKRFSLTLFVQFWLPIINPWSFFKPLRQNFKHQHHILFMYVINKETCHLPFILLTHMAPTECHIRTEIKWTRPDKLMMTQELNSRLIKPAFSSLISFLWSATNIHIMHLLKSANNFLACTPVLSEWEAVEALEDGDWAADKEKQLGTEVTEGRGGGGGMDRFLSLACETQTCYENTGKESWVEWGVGADRERGEEYIQWS